MAGTVLAVPLFSRLVISRRELYSWGEVAPTWWRSIDECITCMQNKMASCSRFIVWNFLTDGLPDSFFHNKPSV